MAYRRCFAASTSSRVLKMASAGRPHKGSGSAKGLGPRILLASERNSTCRQGSRSSFWSRCHLQSQVPYANQIERRESEGEHPIDSISATMSRLSHEAHGLQPSEDFLDSFPAALTDRVSIVPSRSLIDCAAPVTHVHRNVRSHVSFSQSIDELARIVSLVGTNRDAVTPADGVDHIDGRISFSRSRCERQTRVGDEPVAVFHQRMPHISQASFLRLTLAKQARVGVSRRFVRFIRPW